MRQEQFGSFARSHRATQMIPKIDDAFDALTRDVLKDSFKSVRVAVNVGNHCETIGIKVFHLKSLARPKPVCSRIPDISGPLSDPA